MSNSNEDGSTAALAAISILFVFTLLFVCGFVLGTSLRTKSQIIDAPIVVPQGMKAIVEIKLVEDAK